MMMMMMMLMMLIFVVDDDYWDGMMMIRSMVMMMRRRRRKTTTAVMFAMSTPMTMTKAVMMTINVMRCMKSTHPVTNEFTGPLRAVMKNCSMTLVRPDLLPIKKSVRAKTVLCIGWFLSQPVFVVLRAFCWGIGGTGVSKNRGHLNQPKMVGL